MAIKIVTDSTSYLPQNIRGKYGIAVVSLSINFPSESFLEEEISNEVFYAKMAASETIPASSQPSLHALYSAFEKPVAEGHGVVGVFISAAMSGTYSTALTARKMILEKYPQAEVAIVDSQSNCMQLGFAALAGAKAAQDGEDMAQVLNRIDQVIKSSRFLFIPGTLDNLKKGGRIGGASHALGTLLNIRPILTVFEGKTAMLQKVRTQERAIKEAMTIFQNDIRQKGLAEVAVHHIDNQLNAQNLALLIGSQLGIHVQVYPIGPVIGCHVGTGTVGIVYCTKDEL